MSAVSYNAFVPANPVADSLQRAGLAIGNAVLFAVETAVKGIQKIKTRSQLNALSDAQLSDIGLERSDIDAVVAAL